MCSCFIAAYFSWNILHRGIQINFCKFITHQLWKLSRSKLQSFIKSDFFQPEQWAVGYGVPVEDISQANSRHFGIRQHPTTKLSVYFFNGKNKMFNNHNDFICVFEVFGEIRRTYDSWFPLYWIYSPFLPKNAYEHENGPKWLKTGSISQVLGVRHEIWNESSKMGEFVNSTICCFYFRACSLCIL